MHQLPHKREPCTGGEVPLMKILLVNPLWTKAGILPTNLAELAGYARAKGFCDIEIVDLNFELEDEIDPDNLVSRAVERVAAMKPDILGITCNTIHVPFVAEFCLAYRKEFDTPLVLGGIHATFRPRELFSLTGADYIVRGEGEETFTELLCALSEGSPVSRIPGLSYRKRRSCHNPDRRPLEDLSSLPFPAFDLLMPYGHRKNRLYFSGSRGCPFGCQFCSASRMWAGQRRKPIGKILKEIAFLRKHFDFGFVRFNDDCITLHREWLYELLGGLEAAGVQWDCYSRIDTIGAQMMKDMKKAGCLLIYHGIESGSQRLRDMLGKRLPPHITNEHILKTVSNELESGLLVYCSFMTGIPTETEEDMRSTIALGLALKELGATVQFWIMTPYPDIDAVGRYKESLIRLNRWQRLKQADVFAAAQYRFYRGYYEKYKKENPDYYMFRPAMDLRRFFTLYREGRDRLCIQ
jgi:anaerobic magnesium-protoporphyrin IX monomethyl ester cyclase